MRHALTVLPTLALLCACASNAPKTADTALPHFQNYQICVIGRALPLASGTDSALQIAQVAETQCRNHMSAIEDSVRTENSGKNFAENYARGYAAGAQNRVINESAAAIMEVRARRGTAAR